MRNRAYFVAALLLTWALPARAEIALNVVAAALQSTELLDQSNAVETIGDSGEQGYLSTLGQLLDTSEDEGLIEDVCLAQAKLLRPERVATTVDKLYLLTVAQGEVLGKCEDEQTPSTWALNELTALGDPALWPAMEEEINGARWDGQKEWRQEALLRLPVQLAVAGSGVSGLLATLDSEDKWLVAFAGRRLLNHAADQAVLAALTAEAAEVENGLLALLADPGRSSTEYQDYVSRWRYKYRNVVHVLKENVGDRCVTPTAPRDLCTVLD